MQVDIFSDPVCPWCFIGKRRLERALAARPQHGLRVSWRPFQLNPDMALDGMERNNYLARKFGNAEKAAALYDRIDLVGASEGIAFQFAAIRRTPNTVDAHRLARYAHDLGLQDRIMENLFRGYFLEGADIGERETLIDLAGRSGINPADSANFLESGTYAAEVRAEDVTARRIGIQGVPCFVFNGRHVLSGAQPAEVIQQMFDVARADDDLLPAQSS
jgi:predicted DsbA family dithiol-disulfide isomerase